MSDALTWIKAHGGLLGTLTTLLGALSGPPVLAYLPTRYAGALIVIGAIVTAFSKPVALPGSGQ